MSREVPQACASKDADMGEFITHETTSGKEYNIGLFNPKVHWLSLELGGNFNVSIDRLPEAEQIDVKHVVYAGLASIYQAGKTDGENGVYSAEIGLIDDSDSEASYIPRPSPVIELLSIIRQDEGGATADWDTLLGFVKPLAEAFDGLPIERQRQVIEALARTYALGYQRAVYELERLQEPNMSKEI